MAYIMPLFFFIFVVIIHTIFYYHDKSVLMGAASETAIVVAQMDRRKTISFDQKAFFDERIQGKIIYVENIEASVEIDGKVVCVNATASRSFMKIKICQKAFISQPEKKIRLLR